MRTLDLIRIVYTHTCIDSRSRGSLYEYGPYLWPRSRCTHTPGSESGRTQAVLRPNCYSCTYASMCVLCVLSTTAVYTAVSFHIRISMIHVAPARHHASAVLARADTKFSNLVTRLLRGIDTTVLYLDLPSHDLSIRRLYRKCGWTNTKFKLSKNIKKVLKN